MKTNQTNQPKQKKQRNETMNTEVAIEKCDVMGANICQAIHQGQAARVQIVRNDESAVMDFIFGNSNENPCEAVTTAIKEKEAQNTEKLEMLVLSVNTSKVKRKINK